MFHSLCPQVSVVLVGEYVSSAFSVCLLASCMNYLFFLFQGYTPHVLSRMWILHVVAFIGVYVHLCVECMPAS